MNNVSISISLKNTYLELIDIRGSHVHTLSKYSNGKVKCLLKIARLVLILQLANGIDAALAGCMRLPCSVVTRGIRMVQLEALDGIIAGIHHTNTVRSAGAVLSVEMLLIAEVLDELLNVNWLGMRVQVPLTVKAGLIHEEVSVGNNTRNRRQNVVINFVELARLTSLHKKLGDLLLLSAQNNTYL